MGRVGDCLGQISVLSGLIEGFVGRVLASGCSSIQGCLRPDWELLYC